MPLIHRRKLFVDSQVQGALLFRAFLYWLLCVGLMTAMLACWQAFTGPEGQTLPEIFANLWSAYAPALVVSVLVLPLVLFDVVRLSNRFVGPVHRLRHRMRQLARGERVEPIKFRQGDFWLEFADEFNEILALIEQEAKEPLAARAASATKQTVREPEPTLPGARTK